MPSLTFKDLILLVKNAYFCIAKAKISSLDSKFYLILNGTDRLESTFGVVRLMFGNDANTDILTLGYQLSHAIECLNILSEHPEWDCSSRHLHLHGIEDGNGDVLSKSDHITPNSWEGNINVQDVSLVSVWNLGHQLVASEFPASNVEDTLLELESKGYDMEFPFGSVEEPDDENEHESTPIAPEVLSAQDAMTLISSLKLGEGDASNLTLECHVLTSGKGNDPILDLEDHASIETSQDRQGKFSPLVDIGNGKTVPKACILRELERATFSNVPGSTDCLNWCAGLSCYAKTLTLLDLSSDLVDLTCKVLLSIGDPAATVVQCKGQFFLAIIHINEILFDSSTILEISP
ncbi:hypothetical protein EI94DRAFT_1799494 [Lactarius quietus]|nr:hypothetical protein EI94DRAFT_1799494 [Lactarius quietus]